MKKASTLILLFLIYLGGYELLACTVFMKTNGKITLVSANEDFKKQNSQLWFIPAKEGRYGHVIFGYDGSLQSGMNEKGLFWDGLRAYPKSKNNPTNIPLNIGGNVLYKILEECANVDEVIQLFSKYYWEGFQIAQLMVADKNGKSVILTYQNNTLRITKNSKSYQICTNFRISNDDDFENFHWYDIGSGRFKKARKLLDENKFSIRHAFNILEKTAQKNIFAHTIYSSVVDLNSGDIHISVNANFSRLAKINLHQELKKGKHSYYLSELIEHPIKDREDIEINDNKYLSRITDKILFDKNWKLTSNKNKAKFYRIIEKDSSSQSFIKKDFYMNGVCQGIAHYSSLDPEIIDGKYSEFDKNGQSIVEGYYKNRLKDGVWTYWNPEGKIEKKIKFVDGVQK